MIFMSWAIIISLAVLAAASLFWVTVTSSWLGPATPHLYWFHSNSSYQIVLMSPYNIESPEHLPRGFELTGFETYNKDSIWVTSPTGIIKHFRFVRFDPKSRTLRIDSGEETLDGQIEMANAHQVKAIIERPLGKEKISRLLDPTRFPEELALLRSEIEKYR